MTRPAHLLALAVATLIGAGCTMTPPVVPERIGSAVPVVAPPAEAMQSADHLVVTLRPEIVSGDGGRAFAAEFGVEIVAGWPLAAIGVECLVVRDLDGDTEAALARLQEDPRILSVASMLRYSVSTDDAESSLIALQTNRQAIRADDANAIATGRGVKIAVIDTAIDKAHPDMNDAVHDARDFVESESGGTGERHGTAMAGVIAADGRLRGVAYNSELLALRACWEEDRDADGAGVCTTVSLARAINHAIVSNAQIINLSLAGPRDPLLEGLITAGAEQGALFVAAVPTGRLDAFPASHPNVFAVHEEARDTPNGAIVAPGRNVLSAAPDRGYGLFSGASVAAAQVTGIAALLREVAADAPADDIHDALMAATRGGGPVDACKALRLIVGSCQSDAS